MLGTVLGGLAIAGLAGGLKKGRPEVSNTVSGYGALPGPAQEAYLNQVLPTAQNAFNNINRQMPLNRVNTPSDLFGNQGLYNLQQISDQMGGLYGTPNQGISPVEVSPLNGLQTGALSSIMNASNPSNLAGQLQDYQSPYNLMVRDRAINSINDRADQIRSRIMGQKAASGNLASFGGSALGTQLAELDKNTANQVADLEATLGYQGYQEANALRNQQLQQALSGGEYLQSQHQSELDAALGRQHLPYQNAGSLGEIINLATGATGSHIGAKAPGLNGLGKLGSLASFMGGTPSMNGFRHSLGLLPLNNNLGALS